MRVCFDALCFSARRPAVVDEETQTVICKGIDSSLAVLHTGSDGYTIGHTLNYTNYNNNIKNSSCGSSNSNSNNISAVKIEVTAIDDQNHQSMASTTDKMNEDEAQMSTAAAAQPLSTHDSTSMDIENTANNNVVGNNNLDNGVTAILNMNIDKCIENLRNIDFDSNSLNQIYTNFEWTPNETKLLTIVQEKTVQIKELEGRLRQKENEIAELRSHLDKFQSVFPFSRARKAGVNGNIGQRQRAQGISAEPQNETSVLEMLHVTFPKYQKDAK